MWIPFIFLFPAVTKFILKTGCEFLVDVRTSHIKMSKMNPKGIKARPLSRRWARSALRWLWNFRPEDVGRWIDSETGNLPPIRADGNQHPT